jgi:hypothetical protein
MDIFIAIHHPLPRVQEVYMSLLNALLPFGCMPKGPGQTEGLSDLSIGGKLMEFRLSDTFGPKKMEQTCSAAENVLQGCLCRS